MSQDNFSKNSILKVSVGSRILKKGNSLIKNEKCKYRKIIKSNELKTDSTEQKNQKDIKRIIDVTL